MAMALAHRENDCVVLDCVRERRSPFSPEDVVKEFADMLKAYGVATVQGDRFAGEWPVEAFAKHGIRYEVAEKPKSDLYGALLPLLNSRRVELLDHACLTSQLCQLERRTARSRRDSIDHPPGGRDDVVNAAAGALVAAHAAVPALWSAEALLVADRPAFPPHRCEVVYAVLASAPRETAAVYFARFCRVLYVFDCQTGPLSPTFLDGIIARLADLFQATRAPCGLLFVPKFLSAEFARRGAYVEVIEALLAEGAESLGLAAAVHVGAGRVKLCAEALTVRDPLDSHGGDDDPLRLAGLVGVAIGLDEHRTLETAM
jgi:hypothetical protein